MESLLFDRLEFYHHLPTHGVGVEVGVHTGKNASDLLRIADPSGLHLIDTWPSGVMVVDGVEPPLDGSEALEQVRKRFVDNKRVRLHRGVSWEVLETFPDEYFSWAYLDASHSYEDTCRELEVLSRKVSVVISGHDYCHEFPGVLNAVNEFVAASEWRFQFLTYGERWPTFGLVRG